MTKGRKKITHYEDCGCPVRRDSNGKLLDCIACSTHPGRMLQKQRHMSGKNQMFNGGIPNGQKGRFHHAYAR